MRLFLATLLVLASTCLCQAEPISQQLQDATVLLTEGRGHGSGVCFTRTDGDVERTFIWTAAHVGEIWVNPDGTYEEVTVIQGELEGKAKILRCGDYATGPDACVMELIEGDMKGVDIEFFKYFRFMEVGQPIVHCGTPLDRSNERLITPGVISYVEREFCQPGLVDVPRSVDNIDVSGYPGCSGGPVADQGDGGIVGLLVMGSAPRLSIMEPTRNLYEFALAHDCLWAFSREVDLPENRLQWVSDRFKAVTAQRERYNWGRKLDNVERPVPVPEPVEPTCDEKIEEAIAGVLEQITELIEAITPVEGECPGPPACPDCGDHHFPGENCTGLDPNDPQGPRIPMPVCGECGERHIPGEECPESYPEPGNPVIDRCPECGGSIIDGLCPCCPPQQPPTIDPNNPPRQNPVEDLPPADPTGDEEVIEIIIGEDGEIIIDGEPAEMIEIEFPVHVTLPLI